MRIILAINSTVSQRQNYDRDGVVTFFWSASNSCCIPLILPCPSLPHPANVYAGFWFHSHRVFSPLGESSLLRCLCDWLTGIVHPGISEFQKIISIQKKSVSKWVIFQSLEGNENGSFSYVLVCSWEKTSGKTCLAFKSLDIPF